MLHATAPSVASWMNLLDRWYASNLGTTRERLTGRQNMRASWAGTSVMVMSASLAGAAFAPAGVDVIGRW
jgi:hypothetical protein